jgi:hypothetical protein
VLETELTEGGTVLGRFGVPGLTLAVVGIYGVMTYSVSLREREVGIRLALGVDRRARGGTLDRRDRHGDWNGRCVGPVAPMSTLESG